MKKLLLACLASMPVVVLPWIPGVPAADAEERPPEPRPPVFVVEYVVGPAYLPGRPFAEQPGIMEHASYMDQLQASGSLVLGGPLFADLEAFIISGALLVFEVESAEAAWSLAEQDPAIEQGLMQLVDVKPFMAMINPF